MSVNHLFRRLVFAQVLLGIVAFCMAEPNPGLLLVAGALGALSWYVTEGPAARPLPRWAVTLGALAACAWLCFELVQQRQNVLIAMGHFIMWLQVLILYSDKGNREYAQLLVLSLLQMIGASTLPGGTTMIFGALLATYCGLSLFIVLLFQLKLASDQVYEANCATAPRGTYVARPKAVGGRGQRWHFRLAALCVGLACAGIAVAVFILMPRRGDPQFDGAAHNPLAPRQTGFSNQVVLTGGAPGQGRRDAVLSLAVSLHGANIGSDDRHWLLRGAALDRYDMDSHTWVRGSDAGLADQTVPLPRDGLTLADLSESLPMLEAEITMRTSVPRTLFSLHPVVHVASASFAEVTFSPLDQQLSGSESLGGAATYRVRSPLHPPGDLKAAYEAIWSAQGPALVVTDRGRGPRVRVRDPSRYAAGLPQAIERTIEREALRVLVARGLFFDRDGTPTRRDGVTDGQIAQALADYLRDEFRYELMNPSVSAGVDPIVAFLRDHRSGHCELFASAHAAMCRSVGLPARVITGYRVSEYNRIGGYYVVRPIHAHAWTEVALDEGSWRTFDPTPAAPVAAEHRVARGWFTGLRELYDYLEFRWIRTVVAYDRKTRQQLLSDINTSIQAAAASREGWFGIAIAWLRSLPERWALDRISNTLVIFISTFIIIGCLSLIRTLIVRQRRLAALQLHTIPRHKRRGLARRLSFYLRMLDMLERHGYVRPSWQSPFGFAQELAAANSLRFGPVVALTELFYEIRFGHRSLDNDRRGRIKAHLRQLETALSEKVVA